MMFVNLLFLILVLMVINLGVDIVPAPPLDQLPTLLTMGLLLYAFVLLFILFQNTALRKMGEKRASLYQKISLMELLAVFVAFHFFMGGQAAYKVLPAFMQWSFFTELFSVSLYFFGVALIAYSLLPRSLSKQERRKRSLIEVQFLFPFTLPFLFFELIISIADHFSLFSTYEVLTAGLDSWVSFVFLLICFLLFLFIIMTLLPPIVQWCWACKPLPRTPLTERLEALCRKAKFRYAGMKSWTVMKHATTAAIIGIIPRLRYVMFTNKLFKQLSSDEVEAVLAHEIGHSYRKHLVFYPFVILGMVVLSGLFIQFFGQSATVFFTLMERLYPSSFWDLSFPLAIFVAYAIFVIVYFRVVYGFFSRLFERQADLHVFHLDLAARSMIDALDKVGTLQGGIHKDPNWHHYSIQQRCDFLRAADANPALIRQHHRKAKIISRVYISCLFILFLFFSAPALDDLAFLKPARQGIEFVQKKTSEVLNTGLRKELATEIAGRYQTPPKKELIAALDAGLERYGAISYPGIAEFYASQTLLHAGDWKLAARLMADAWMDFDFSLVDASVVQDFDYVTGLIASHAAFKMKEKGVEDHSDLIELQHLLKRSALAKQRFAP